MFGDVGKDALKRDPGLALHAVEEAARLLIAHLGGGRNGVAMRERNGGSHTESTPSPLMSPAPSHFPHTSSHLCDDLL